jgi:hypothetical protein
MGIKTLLGNLNRVINLQKEEFTNLRGKIKKQQDYEGKNPKNMFLKIQKSRKF